MVIRLVLSEMYAIDLSKRPEANFVPNSLYQIQLDKKSRTFAKQGYIYHLIKEFWQMTKHQKYQKIRKYVTPIFKSL